MNPTIKRRNPRAQSTFNDLPSLLQRIYLGRGITSKDELDTSLATLHPAQLLSGINAACDLLEEAIAKNNHIIIVADFDADGATSCAVAIRALRAMGAQSVSYLVPNRFEYGYGLTVPIVELAKREKPDLLVTVDNGISSIDGVAAARDLGMKVLVTDHHLPGSELPNANAIVNPNLDNDIFPSKALAGVGVIFYIVMALRARLRENGWFVSNHLPEPNLAELLDLVALGTVADVVPLDRNNRCLSAQGLARIRAGKMVPGIKALFDVAGSDHRTVSSSDLGFTLGPRLNAAGRLADMSLGIECLLSDDDDKCAVYAERLNALNIERREIEKEMQFQALELVEQIALDATSAPLGITLFDPGWHQGVVGIVASRIKDKFNRPVIAFAPNETGEELKGSGRSIQGVHLRDVLDAVATKHSGLLSKFGGHAMAAGLSLPSDHLDAFRSAFNLEIERVCDDRILQKIVETDGPLVDDEFDLRIADQLNLAAPWGQAFPPPLFDNVFDVIERRIVGDSHVKMRLRLIDGHRVVDAIAFNAVEQPWAHAGSRIEAVYRLAGNEYRGQRSVQLMVEFARDAS